MFIEYNFDFLIDKPTRITGNVSSTIDHMWSNLKKSVQAFVINSPISDHLLSLASFEIKPASAFILKKFRDISDSNIQKYITAKKEIFNSMKPRDNFDTDILINKILEVFPLIINNFFPLDRPK